MNIGWPHRQILFLGSTSYRADENMGDGKKYAALALVHAAVNSVSFLLVVPVSPLIRTSQYFGFAVRTLPRSHVRSKEEYRVC